MNKRMVFYILGLIMLIEAALMAVPLAVALIYGEGSIALNFLMAIGIEAAIGGLLVLLFRRHTNQIFAKEGFVIVSLGWFAMTLFGALPFVFAGAMNLPDALFEVASGLSTTGASILNNLESMSRGLMFWRSATHWIGGMGVLVFMMAILPTDSDGSVHILRAEMTGPTFGKLVPRLRKSATILYLIYVGITVLEVIFLLFGGKNLYESFVYAFGTAGTGGFGLKGDSMASESAYVQWVLIAFMILFGVNFNLYYMLLLGKAKDVFRNRELWFYMGVLGGSSIILATQIRSIYGTMSETIRTAVFQAASMTTTTGFASADFDKWSGLAKGVLFILLFVGGCAGSTAGGLKMARIMLLGKGIKRDLRHMTHPHSVGVVKMEGRRVDNSVISGVMSYFAVYCLVLAIVFLLLCVFDPQYDLITNISASVSTINNVGPGFSAIGPMMNYSGYSIPSKLILTVSMLIGRLEFYPILLCFAPGTWKRR